MVIFHPSLKKRMKNATNIRLQNNIYIELFVIQIKKRWDSRQNAAGSQGAE